MQTAEEYCDLKQQHSQTYVNVIGHIAHAQIVQNGALRQLGEFDLRKKGGKREGKMNEMDGWTIGYRDDVRPKL
jgi:hypothetical protein